MFLDISYASPQITFYGSDAGPDPRVVHTACGGLLFSGTGSVVVNAPFEIICPRCKERLWWTDEGLEAPSFLV